MTALETAVRIESALDDALRLLRVKINEANADDVLGLKIQKEELIGKQAMVRSQKLALFANATAFPAPSDEQAERVAELATMIDGMVASATAVDALFDSVKSLLETWSEVRS